MNSALTKRLLIESFLKRCNKTSYRKVHISDVTKDLGISKRTFFYHFRDKEQFLEAVVDYLLSDPAFENASLKTCEVFWHICDRLDAHYTFSSEYAASPLSDKLHSLIYEILEPHVRRELSSPNTLDNDTNQLDVEVYFNTHMLMSNLLSRCVHHAVIADKTEYAKDLQVVKDLFYHFNQQKLSPFIIMFYDDGLMGDDAVDRALMEALIQLAKERPFEQIRVQDITGFAKVSRSTFYRRGYTKFSIRSQLWVHDITQLLRACMNGPWEFDSDTFHEKLQDYYSANKNLYESGFIYDELDSLYYTLQGQFRKNIHTLSKTFWEKPTKQYFALEGVTCAMADLVFQSLTDRETLAFSTGPDQLIYGNTPQAVRLWDSFIDI